MRRLRWMGLVVLLATTVGYAQPLGDMAAIVGGLVEQLGGDAAVARDLVDQVGNGAPELTAGTLDTATATEALLGMARMAGIPAAAVAAVEDPAATLRALQLIANSPDLAIAVLDATARSDRVEPAGVASPAPGDRILAQAPPANEPDVAAPTAPPDDPNSLEPTGNEATVLPIDATAVGVATYVELALVIIAWLTLTWLIFFVTWRLFLGWNPFLAVRLAYTVSVLSALAYLVWVFWPKYFAFTLPEQYGYLPYVAAAVLAVIVTIVVWVSYQTESDGR